MNNFWSVLCQGYDGQGKIRPVRHASLAMRARPFFALAPLAGYTDQPMRLMCKSFGVDVLYSEMVSSEALWHNRINYKSQTSNNKQNLNSKTLNSKQLLKTLNLIKFAEAERPFVVQIFGSNPEHMAYAAKYIASGNWYIDYLKITNNKFQKANNLKFDACDLELSSIPSGIDINMGCPVRDVTKTGAGAALLKNPELAVKIIKAIKKEVKNIPISVKTRLGWENHDEILAFSKHLETAGIDALAIHGRTYKEGFSGEVDWKMIEKVKSQLKIPVIGNGGIDDNFKFKISNLKLNCDGYMIGTGAIGKPWIFNEIKTLCHSGLVCPQCLKHSFCRRDPESQRSRNEFGMTINNIKQSILKHAKLVQEIKGEQGIIEFRKHMAWYLKGLPDSKELKSKLVRVNNYQEIVDTLSKNNI